MFALFGSDERSADQQTSGVGETPVDTEVDRTTVRSGSSGASDEGAGLESTQDFRAKQLANTEPLPTVDSRRPISGTASTAATARAFGDYELLDEIARGGMGVVFKARQMRANRVVALKMILSGNLAGQDEVDRFYTEAEAAANLDHPNIVPVYDVGQIDGQHYFSMGFVDGQSLKDRLSDGPLPARDAAQLTRTIAEAVAYAHDKGIIHRDLKPANVLLDHADNPRITDFGLAKRLDSESELTASGQVMGTPQYMPPEQAAGKIDSVGPTADVYSLGAILYCLLAGRPPFQAASVMETLGQVLQKEPVPPSELNPAIDRDLETICLKCLEKEIGRRYASAHELFDELGRYLAGQPIQARPIGSLAKAWRWCKRNPVVASLATAATTFLVVGTVVSASLAYVANERAIAADTNAEKFRQQKEFAKSETERANQERNRATDERDEAQRQRESAERQLYLNHIQSAQREWDNGNAAAVLAHLNACPERLRGWEYRYLYSLFIRNQQALKGHTDQVYSVAFNSDGTRIVTGSLDKTLKLWDTSTGEVLLTLEGHTDGVRCAALSTDGSRIVSGAQDNTLVLWDARTGEHVRVFKGHTASVIAVAFSPDGNRIASGSEDGTFRIWDAATGEAIRTTKVGDFPVFSVAYSPDGGRVISASLSIRIWDADTGESMLRFKGQPVPVFSVAFSPDGNRVVSGGYERTVKLWDASTGESAMTLKGHTDLVTTVAFSADGSRIVSGSSDDTLKVWDADTGEELQMFKDDADVHCAAFSPDGTRIISGGFDQTLNLWNGSPVTDALTLAAKQGYVVSVSFSPDGSRLVSGGLAPMVRLWDARTGKETLAIQETSHLYSGVAFSPDGSRIVGGNSEKALKMWDARTGEETAIFEGHTGPIWSVAFSPDGNQIVSGSHDHTIRLWDAGTGKETSVLSGHTAPVTAVAFSPDGKHIVSGSDDNSLRLWDVATGEQTRILSGHAGRLTSVAFSPDGSRIVSGGGVTKKFSELKLWDASTGDMLMTFEGHTDIVDSVAFSPDGSRIVSGCFDKTLKLWDARNGEEVFTLRGHKHFVKCVAFNPDGSSIVSGSHDMTLKLWDASLHRSLHRRQPADDSAELDQVANHEHRAALGERVNDWYAAAFHLGWLTVLNPDDASLQERRAIAESKLRDRGLAIPKLPSRPN